MTSESGLHSIGLQLHYTGGPQQVRLLKCSGSPSVSNCNIPASDPQDNSGTLRISIKRNEHASDLDVCDYHVHRAYHKMLNLLDPGLTYPNNAKKRYVEVPAYDEVCTPCDPQQDSVNSDCVGMSMTTSQILADISGELGELVKFVQHLNLTDQQKKQLKLESLITKADHFSGKFLTQTQLLGLKTNFLRANCRTRSSM
jgi:hypothetical protein